MRIRKAVRGAACVRNLPREDAYMLRDSRGSRAWAHYIHPRVYIFLRVQIATAATRSFLLTLTTTVCILSVTANAKVCAMSHFLLLNLFLVARQIYITIATEVLDNI